MSAEQHRIPADDKPAPAPFLSASGCMLAGFSLAALFVAGAAYLVGEAYRILVLSLPIVAALTILARMWQAFRGQIVYDLALHPLALEYRRYRWHFALRAATYLLALSCLLMAIPRSLIPDPSELLAAVLIFGWIPAGLLVLLQLFPPRTLSKSLNLLHAAAAVWLAAQLIQVYVAPQWSTPVPILPPFQGEWVVMQGGRSVLINHHYPLASQRFALDLIQLRGGQPVQGDPQLLTSYACFDQPLYAPISGKVVRVVADRPDQPIGSSDVDFVVGNHVVIQFSGDVGKFVLLAHLKQSTVVVKEGEQVAAGDLLARCGNSGNTSEPHLHLQIQTHADFETPALATYPIRFEQSTVRRRGEKLREEPGELRRDDRIMRD